MANENHYTMRLNNYLQARFGASARNHYKYEVKSSGPQNHVEWEGTYRIDDIMYGVAKASSKRDANEGAAKKTIEMLEREGQIVA
ncbi:hypothetical protein M405DRAFT_863450 [Rhizopogon salebrosus TDB-379]|nr:hypothetical protein M405DRAFT_863450 [Rhizopogon salebrosus TDB-379]